MYYILGILALGIMILVHEFGHFIMMKLFNVKVEAFNIGFGPNIITHKGKETDYNIALLPVGGFVLPLSKDDEEGKPKELTEEEEERCIEAQSSLKKILIYIAGPMMNIILAIILFSTVFMYRGFATIEIASITDDGAAHEIGMEVGDKILSINGDKVFTTDDISIEVNYSKGKPMDIRYEKANGEIIEKTITPKYAIPNENKDGYVYGEDTGENKGQYLIGIGFKPNVNPTFTEAAKHSAGQIGTLVTKNISLLTQGKVNFKTDVGGPVSIVQISSSAAKSGLISLLYMVGILSVSLGVCNMIPIPMLDGGRCLIAFIEMVARRKVPKKVINVLNTISFVILFALMIIVTIKDILFPMAL